MSHRNLKPNSTLLPIFFQNLNMPCKALISPAQNLPSDILEQIFLLVAHSAKDSKDPLQPLRCFTAVNHHWNHVSHSCTRLWQNLGDIRVGLHHCRPESAGEFFISSLEGRLERAKSQPLTFSFNVAPTLAYGPPRDLLVVIERALALLIRHAAQWVDVGLSIPARQVHMLDTVEGNLPLLEKLSMEVLQPDVPARMDQFAIAPSLRHASFRFPGRVEVDVRKKIKLPWSQLISYHENIYPEDVGFHPVLTTSPNLESLICAFPWVRLPYFLDTPFQHTNLTRLHLKFISDDSSFLRRLILPSLSDLSVVTYGVATVFTEVIGLVHQSHCVLRSLALLPEFNVSWFHQHWALTRILALCPALTRLTVNNIQSNDLKLLCDGTETGEILVPHLKQFVLCYTSRFPTDPVDDYDALNALAHSREELYQSGQISSPWELTIESAPNFSLDESIWSRILRQLEAFPQAMAPGMEKVSKWEQVLLGQVRFARRVAASAAGDNPKAGPTLLEEVMNSLQLRNVIKELEGFDFAKDDVGLLYRGNMPHLLERLASISSASFPLEIILGLLGLSTRVKALFEKWKPLFIEHARVHRRWMRRGKQSIEYISPRDERRKDDGLVWEIVVGALEQPRTPAQWLEVGIWL
ncbi:hypothetical protein D9611_003744 [Ephemerocybe angulata]|uniref:F-box domain-containing protein n=1 Tax=Ephemerocybe angulata TaxID=980116 RepID=A0A8H5B621_9AGAR|nr:hypothetical protein D9611_003744 [Tulosesus angulatus]